MTRVYAFTVVCDVYGWPGCHNTFVAARAGVVPDVLEAPEAQAEAAGWKTAHRLRDMRLIDVCPVCAAGMGEDAGPPVEADWLEVAPTRGEG